jgi:hypothetical protein
MPTGSLTSSFLKSLGWLSIPGMVALTSRLVYEQTLLTWRNGMQMVGYSLSHAYTTLFLWMLLSAVIAIAYLLSIAVVSAARWFRSEPVRFSVMPAAALLLFFGLLFIPYEMWMVFSLRLGVAQAHQAEYLVHGAATGHKYLVNAILRNGVGVDESGESSGTALNAACVSRKFDMARYLISKGADLSHAPDCKWVPEVGGKVLPRVPGTTVEVRP